MGAGEIGDGPFDFCHAGAAVPTGGEMSVNSAARRDGSSPSAAQKQFLIR